jgi:hypothetical protein
LGCAASCILENLFIFHRVASSVCAGDRGACCVVVPFGAMDASCGQCGGARPAA